MRYSEIDDDVVELSEEELDRLIDKRVEKRLGPAAPTIIGKMGPPDTTKDPHWGRPNLMDLAEAKGKFDAAFEKTKLPTYSLTRAISAMISNDWSLAPLEKEVSDYVQKTLTWASGSAGGLWVPTQFMGDEFIELLRSRTVCRRAGCRVIQATNAIVQLPKLAAGTSGEWITQDSASTLEDVTPDQVTLTPHICMVLTKTTRLQNFLSGGSTEQILREDIAAAIARKVDYAMLRGSGTNNEPEGMANTSGINVVEMTDTTATGAPLTDGDLFWNMLYELEADDVPTDNLAWFVHPRTMMQIRTLKVGSGDNRYIYQPDLTGKSPGLLCGWPVYTTTQIPIDLTTTASNDGTEIYLVNMDDLILCEWGAIRVEATSVGGTNVFENDLVMLKCVSWMDCCLRHAESCCLCNDVSAA